MNVELITFETKCIGFIRFSSTSINLLEIFRIISFIFNLKYLSQNSINFNMLGVFWNSQDGQISILFLDLHLEQYLKEIFRVLHCQRSCWPPLHCSSNRSLISKYLKLCHIYFILSVRPATSKSLIASDFSFSWILIFKAIVNQSWIVLKL